jgi:hypothetical protein
VKHLRAWAGLWIVLWWLWLLLAGEWNRYEWIAATAAATVGATVGEIALVRARVRVRVPLKWLTRGWTAFLVVFSDFAVVMWALVRSALRREVVTGEFRTKDFGRSTTGVRVWRNLLANYSPNAYVVDIDTERNVVLLHDLIPLRKSEEPA